MEARRDAGLLQAPGAHCSLRSPLWDTRRGLGKAQEMLVLFTTVLSGLLVHNQHLDTLKDFYPRAVWEHMGFRSEGSCREKR